MTATCWSSHPSPSEGVSHGVWAVDALLRVKGLIVGHGGFRSQPQSFSVASGEVAALVGPSGCGKTSFLRAVAGLAKPVSGTIDLGNVPGRGNRRGGAASSVVVCFQEPRLLPWRSASQNVLFGLGRRHKAADVGRVSELFDRLGLGGLDQRLPAELSGGQRRRVAIARTLIAPSRVVLIDEPFAYLDEASSSLVASVLHMRKEEGAAILLAVHSVVEAVGLTTNLVDMDRAVCSDRVVDAGSVVDTSSVVDIDRGQR